MKIWGYADKKYIFIYRTLWPPEGSIGSFSFKTKEPPVYKKNDLKIHLFSKEKIYFVT